MRLSSQSIEFVAHDQPELSNQNHDEHDGSKDGDEEDLEVELHQPDPCRSVKGLPSIKHRHGTAAAQNLRFDFATEGAVEEDNSLILLRQHGSLDTLECDVGWDDDKNEDANADETDEEHLQQGNILRASDIFTGLFIESLGSKEEKSAWHVDCSLFGDGEDSGGNEDVPNSSPGGDAAEPALAAAVRDDDVGPGHLKTAKRDACEDGNEGASDRVADDVGAEEADDAAVQNVIDD